MAAYFRNLKSVLLTNSECAVFFAPTSSPAPPGTLLVWSEHACVSVRSPPLGSLYPFRVVAITATTTGGQKLKLYNRKKTS